MKLGNNLFSVIAITMATALSAFGAGVTGDDAKGAVTGWVRLREALGDEIDAEPESVATYPGADGRGEFHVVNLKGGGYVITSGDTEITPILGYSKTGTFDADENNPMWALLTADVAARAAAVEASGSSGAGLRLGGTESTTDEDAASEWSRLMAAGKSGGKRLQTKMSSPPTDLRVASFVRSKWSQSTATSGNGYTHNYYNYYTPNNYPCGCVATALAQTMRYFEFPKTSVTAKTFTCKVGGASTDLTMQGGTYDWAHMPYVPREVTYDWNNVIGIAKLTSDAGISICMSYNSGGSSSSSSRVGDSLVSTFGYSNAVMDYSNAGIKGNAFKQNVIPSLDAKLPVVLGIQGRPTGSVTADAGHSIVTDGYGYYNNQLYIHLNMGWSGSDDAWYTPADASSGAIINASNYDFTNITCTVFNIFTNATQNSVIASGRVLDQSGEPISGATVTAKYNSTTYATATSDARGVYALILPPTSSTRTYMVNATCPGYTSTGARSVSASLTKGDTARKEGNNYTGSIGLTSSNSNSYDNDITMESDNLPQAATPTSATAAEFGTSANVTLTCSTAGASIYYTLDGSTPTVSSTLYTGPIAITKTTTVKALAAKSGYARSDVFTRTFVSAAAIDEFYFRHDFSNGTRVFTAGEGSGLTRDQTNSTDSNAKAVEGPDGPGTAHHPGNVWGQFEDPTVLHGAWSAAMSLCMDATETGALISFGRLNKEDQKEVALLSSSTKSNFYFKVMTTDSNKAKSVENTFTVVTTNDLTVGFHSIVVAYKPASEVLNGIGLFDIYCDGVLVRTVSTDTPKLLGADVGGMQYCMLMSGGSDLAALGTVSSQANDAVAFYDFRFYDRAFTASEAAKYAAAYYPYDPNTPAQWTNNDGTGSFDNAANWAGGRVPHSGDFIVNISGDTAIAVTNAYNLGAMTVQGTGNVTFTGAGSIGATTLDVASGLTVDTCGKLTVTDFTGAGNVVLTPASGTLAISSASTLTGDLTIKTDSSVAFNVNAATSVSNFYVRAATNAVVTMTVSGGSFISAEAIVQHGVLKQGSANALGATPKVTVEDGGTFDFDGKVVGDGEAVTGKVVTEFHIAGAGAGDWPWALTSSENMTSGKNVCMLHLDANATVGGAKELWMGVRNGAGWNAANKNLNLNGFTLTKTGAGTLQVRRPYSKNEGTIDVQSGSLKVTGWSNANAAYGESCVSNIALVVHEGTTAENSVGYPLYFKALDCRGGTLTTSANAFGVWEALSGHGTTAKLVMAGGATATLDGNLTVSSAMTAAGALSLTRAAGVETNVTVAATGTLTASGAITVGAGVIFNIGANRPTATLTVADDATIVLRKNDDLEVNIVLNVTARPQNVVVYDTDGTTVISDPTITYNSGEGTLTIRVVSPHWRNNDGTGSLDNAANWNVTPESGEDVSLDLSGDTAFTSRVAKTYGQVSFTGAYSADFSGVETVTLSSIELNNLTNLVTGGNLRFTAIAIPSTCTVTITGAEGLGNGGFTGSGTLVIDPGEDSTYTMTKSNTGYTGEAVVKSGTVKFGDSKSFGPIARSSVIRVKGGATLDENGSNAADTTYGKEKQTAVLEDGARLVSNPGISDAKLPPLTTLTLDGDATVDTSSGRVSIAQHYNDNPTHINLGTHTLTKVGANDFFISQCAIAGTGVFDIQQGAVVSTHDYDGDSTTTCANGTIRIREGASWKLASYHSHVSKLSVKNLILDGSVTRDANTYTLTVTGSITGNGTTPTLAMGSGAVFKPTGTGYLTITASLSGTLRLDLTGLDLSSTNEVPLVKVPSSLATSVMLNDADIPQGWDVQQIEEGDDSCFLLKEGYDEIFHTRLFGRFAKRAEDFDVGDYVQTGLVAHFDGIRNAGSDLPHDSTTRTWKNLVSGGPDAAFVGDGGEWNAAGNGFVFDGSSVRADMDSPGIDMNHVNSTVQIACDVDYTQQSNGSGWYPGIFVMTDQDYGIFINNTGSSKSNVLNYKPWPYSNNDSNQRPSINPWGGKYVTAAFNGNKQYLVEGTSLGEGKSRTSYTDQAAKRFAWGGNPSGSTRYVKGTYHSVRVYNATLSERELAWNRIVDEARFRGNLTPAGGDIVIASNTPGVDGSEPCGEYMVNGSHTFSAASQMVNGSMWELTGYTLEKWDTGSWAFVTNSEASAFAYTNSVQNGRMRLTWNWVAATPRWTNTDGTGSFDSAANWTVMPGNGDDVILELSDDTLITATNAYNLGAMTVTGTGNVTFTGDGCIGATTLDVASGLTVDTSGKLTVNGFTGAGNVVLTPASGTLAISSASTLTGNLTIKTDSSVAFNVNAATSVSNFFVRAATNAVVTMTVGSGGSFKATSEAIVQHGVLKQGGNNVLGTTPKISVENGGTFDINAKTIRQETPIYIAGAGAGKWPWALASSAGAMASGNYLFDLYLTADATIGAGQFKIGRDDDESYIYLNGHTLKATSWLTLRNVNTKNGTIDLRNSATLNLWNNLNSQTKNRGTTLIVRQGHYVQNKTNRKISVSNLIMYGGSITDDNDTAQTFGIISELRGHGTITKLVMESGAKFYPDGADYLNVTKTLSGKLKVDISDPALTGKAKIPLLKVPVSLKETADGAFDLTALPPGWQLQSKDDGVNVEYLIRNLGFSIFIR